MPQALDARAPLSHIAIVSSDRVTLTMTSRMTEHLGYANTEVFVDIAALLVFPQALQIILLDAADTVANWESLIAQHSDEAQIIILGEHTSVSNYPCLSKPIQKAELAAVLEGMTPLHNGMVVEAEAVEELLALFGAAGLAEMIDALHVDLPQQKSRLHHAVNAGDFSALKQVAHALHGVALQFGANKFAAFCSDIERRCAERDGGIFTAPEACQMMDYYAELISQLAKNRYVD